MGDPIDFTACPHWGKGGRYIVDQATGKRVPVLTSGDGVQKTPVAGETLTASAQNKPKKEK